MITLIGSPKSRGFRVLWMLEELNVEYDLIATGPHREEISKCQSFRKKYPHSKMTTTLL